MRDWDTESSNTRDGTVDRHKRYIGRMAPTADGLTLHLPGYAYSYNITCNGCAELRGARQELAFGTFPLRVHSP